VAVGAASQAAVGDPDLDRRRVQGGDVQAGGDRAARVVLVGDGRAEDRVQVRALVADRQLEHVAAVLGEHRLHAAHEGVELRARGRVVLEVDGAELHEHRDGGPQLGEELAAAGLQALVDRPEQPRADLGVGERAQRILQRGRSHRDGQPADDRELLAGLAEVRAAVERPDRGAVGDHLALSRVALGRGQPVERAPGEGVRELDLGVADQEPARAARGDGDLHPERDRGAAGDLDAALARERVLHREGRSGGAEPVVAVEPARDGVAAEVDDAAAVAVDLCDQRVEDAVEVRAQRLRCAVAAERVRERLGQRGEAGDVGEHARALRPLGERAACGDRDPAIARDVRLRRLSLNFGRHWHLRVLQTRSPILLGIAGEMEGRLPDGPFAVGCGPCPRRTT
jgi:hypothetical protein